MSLEGLIKKAAFPGMSNIWKNCIDYDTGDPDNVLEIDTVSPYGAGTMTYDGSTGAVYFKTDTDSTSWIELTTI